MPEIARPLWKVAAEGSFGQSNLDATPTTATIFGFALDANDSA